MDKVLYPELSYAVVGAAMDVHNELGPGFPEAVYQVSMQHEFTLREIPFASQFHVPVTYKGVVVADYYLDLVADGKIDVELKALGELAKVHQAQVIAYLKASGLRLGILINFGREKLETKRIIL